MKLIKKSIDFHDVNVRIDSVEQETATELAPKQLVKMLRSCMRTVGQFEAGSCKIDSGVIYLTKKTEGLYQGVLKDEQGIVKSTFDNATVEMVARDLVVKGYYEAEEEEESETKSPTYIKIKCGDFELELKKSLAELQEKIAKPTIQKAVTSWKTAMTTAIPLRNNKEAISELLRNWDMHKESFSQIVYGINKSEE